MKRKFHTKQGVTERELTAQELQEFADTGDDEARREILQQRLTGKTDTEKIALLTKYILKQKL